MRLTMAAAAPFASAWATKSWPSRMSVSATKRSPGCRVRVSIETPVACQSAVARPGWPWRPRWRSRASCGDPWPDRRGGLSAPAFGAPREYLGQDEGALRSRQITPSRAATAIEACSTSSKGKISPLMTWPVSWPLPAIRSASPGCSASTARRMASARSPTSLASGQAARMAARMAAGSSERGLSSVTKRTSAWARGGSAHQRALGGVAVAAGAEGHDRCRPMTCGRSACSAVCERRRGYGRNRQRPRRHWPAWRPVASGRARRSAAAAWQSTASGASPAAMARPAARATFSA